MLYTAAFRSFFLLHFRLPFSEKCNTYICTLYILTTRRSSVYIHSAAMLFEGCVFIGVYFHLADIHVCPHIHIFSYFAHKCGVVQTQTFLRHE